MEVIYVLIFFQVLAIVLGVCAIALAFVFIACLYIDRDRRKQLIRYHEQEKENRK